MDNDSRTQKSLKNIFSSFYTYFLNIILQFLNRTIFLAYLSIDYLGINGLFSNLISMLNLAELGIAGAMVYALYKPLAEQDTDRIKSLMYLYKKLYSFVGIFVLFVGFLITPFLGFFINGNSSNIKYLKFYFILYVVDTGISYFLSFKRSIIICAQKQYIINRITIIRIILTNVFQIIILIFTRSYALYLLVKIFCTLIENIIVTLTANHKYPFLKEKANMPSKKDVKEISKNIMAMSMHKIGTVVVFSTDNLIITRFVSLAATGIYSNYTLIINALNSIIGQFFQSVTASVGNLIAKENKESEHVYQVFRNILFINFIVYLIISIGIFFSINSFICFWVGKKYVLDKLTILCIVLSFYTLGMRKTIMMFKDADGLFWNDRYKPILEAFFNLFFSIPLAIHFGIAGTLMGTIITNVFVAGVIETYVTYKYLFRKKIKNYYVIQIKYFLTLFFLLSILNNINFYTNNYLIDFILRGLIAIILCLIVIFIIYRKNNEFKYIKYVVLNLISSIHSKK